MSGNPRVVFLRHAESEFDREVIGRSLYSETKLVGELCVESDIMRKYSTVKHEYKRSGLPGLLDSLFFRLHYSLFLQEIEGEKIEKLIDGFKSKYSPQEVPTFSVSDPNSKKSAKIIEDLDPDILVARTKVLLDERIFSIPTHGTVVIHPGICPEYRNQHGCFWALANGEPDRVGYSLLRIDEGIDTGAIISQGGTSFSPASDEHEYIQYKVVADNLSKITDSINDIATSESIDVSERESALWGMPKYSAWKTWKRRAKKFNRTHYNSANDV